MRLDISSRAEPIHKLLGNGIEKRCITNFYGLPGAGKTQVALCIAASLVEQGEKIVFVDTETGFSFERFLELCGGKSDLLKNIILFEPCTWDEQKSLIQKIKKIKTSAVIVDSLVALWRIELSEENVQKLSRELSRFIAELAAIAKKNNLAVITTNQVYTEIESGELELSGRYIVKWWSKNLVELIHFGRAGKRIAVLKKSRNQKEEKKVAFEITSTGLKDVKLGIF